MVHIIEFEIHMQIAGLCEPWEIANGVLQALQFENSQMMQE
jgi:hypothetical protein